MAYKSCDARRAAERKWAEKNRETIRIKNRARMRKWRIDNHEKAKERDRIWHRNHSESINAKMKARRKINGPAIRARAMATYYLRTYGLTKKQYDEMLDSQGQCCALCKSTEGGNKWSSFSVDHDHNTGVVRGLLCRACNMGLGAFNDSESVLAAAAHYVMRNRIAVA